MKDKSNQNSESTKEIVLFVTKAKFPDKNAFATYIGGIASVFSNSNFDVICIGNGDSQQYKSFVSYFGKYVSLRNNKCKSVISKISNQLHLEKRIFSYLKNNFSNPKHIFFSCEFSLSFYKRVKELYRRKETNFSFILTEEYTKDEFEKFTILSKRAMKINHHFIYDYDSSEDSFIVISRYLFEKISGRGLNCIYVPFCFNLLSIPLSQEVTANNKEINYIYCGNPENKDLLPTIIRAFSSFSQSVKDMAVYLNIIGVDEGWAKKHHIGLLNSHHIKFYGKQSRDFVFEQYLRSDYSILLRDENKVFAKAGFPTKISESMMLGVTPITNLTSNLSDYLNSKNSIIVNGHEESDLLESLIISANDIKNNRVRKETALNTAKSNFNIENYKDLLLSLISKQI